MDLTFYQYYIWISEAGYSFKAFSNEDDLLGIAFFYIRSYPANSIHIKQDVLDFIKQELQKSGYFVPDYNETVFQEFDYELLNKLAEKYFRKNYPEIEIKGELISDICNERKIDYYDFQIGQKLTIAKSMEILWWSELYVYSTRFHDLFMQDSILYYQSIARKSDNFGTMFWPDDNYFFKNLTSKEKKELMTIFERYILPACKQFFCEDMYSLIESLMRREKISSKEELLKKSGLQKDSLKSIMYGRRIHTNRDMIEKLIQVFPSCTESERIAIYRALDVSAEYDFQNVLKEYVNCFEEKIKYARMERAFEVDVKSLKNYIFKNKKNKKAVLHAFMAYYCDSDEKRREKLIESSGLCYMSRKEDIVINICIEYELCLDDIRLVHMLLKTKVKNYPFPGLRKRIEEEI